MRLKESLSIIGIIIGILTGLISLIFFSIKGFEIEKRQIRTQSLAIEELTSFRKEEGFSAYYMYDSQKVEKLWRLVIVSKNAGNKSIIGEGYKSNLLKNVFTINIPKNFRLLNNQVLKNDIDANLSIDSINTLNIRFSQWRPDEELSMALFIESLDKNNNMQPILSFNERDLIDCSFLFRNATNEFFIKHPISTVRKYLPDFLIMILASITMGLFFYSTIPFIDFCIKAVIKHLAFRKWKVRYYEKYVTKIERLKLDRTLKDEYIKTPRKAPKDIWGDTQIPKPDFPETLLLNSFSFMAFLCMFLCGTMGMIIYFILFF